MVVLGVVTASKSNEDHIVTYKPCGSSSSSQGAYGYVDASGSGSVISSGENDANTSNSISQQANKSEEPSHQALSYGVTILESAAAPQADFPAPVAEEKNQWCVDCLY